MVLIEKIFRKLFHKSKKKLRTATLQQENADYLYDVMMGKILIHIRRTRGLSGKTLRVVLVDDDYEGAELVIQKIYPDLNYLTIVTKEEERFENLAEDICYDSGLMLGFSESIPREADVILEPAHRRIQINRPAAKNHESNEFLIYRDDILYGDGRIPEMIELSSLRFTLNGILYDAPSLQKKLWGETTSDLRLFGNGEIPEEYVGCIDISGSKRV